MRRAVWLIVTLTLLGVGCGIWADITQRDTARGYLAGMEAVREAVLAGDMQSALSEQRYWHALWQHDEEWLNYLASHRQTRAISLAMAKLATALEQSWRDEALRALDEAVDAFEDVERGEMMSWENVL